MKTPSSLRADVLLEVLWSLAIRTRLGTQSPGCDIEGQPGLRFVPPFTTLRLGICFNFPYLGFVFKPHLSVNSLKITEQ